MSRVQVMVDAGFSVRQAHAITGVIAATVSAAGSTQSDATLLESDNNLITTASAGQGVRLPLWSAGDIVVANGSTVPVLVYPATGGAINNGTTNAGVTLPAGLCGIFEAISATAILGTFASKAGMGLPTSSTDNTAARFDGTAGALQGSALVIADTTGALSRSGDGGIPVQGTNTNDNAAAGQVGEYTESIIAAGSAVSLTTATPANVTSLSLSAGDWDVWGAVSYGFDGTTNVTLTLSSISLVSATLNNTQGQYFVWRFGAAGLVPQAEFGGNTIGPVRMSLASTTTVYLVARADFTVSTSNAYGALKARRVR